jgi:hypothetical protein
MTIAFMPTITLADYRISAIAGEGQSASYNPSLIKLMYRQIQDQLPRFDFILPRF